MKLALYIIGASALITAGYMLYLCGLDLKRGLSLVKSAHCGIDKNSDFIDIPSWKRDVGFSRWKKVLDLPDDEKLASRLRLSTSRGRPLGTDAFIAKLETLLGRRLRPMPRGRPAKKLIKEKGKIYDKKNGK